MKLLIPQKPTTTQVVFTYSRIHGKIKTGMVETWAKNQINILPVQPLLLSGESHEIRTLQTH